MKNGRLLAVAVALAACALTAQADKPDGKADSEPGGKAFPTRVQALTGAPPEGFTIGKGTIAYNSSVDGSIYRVDLRSGQGNTIVDAEPGFDIFTQCFKLGMRVDPRSNYLFVAGCLTGNAYIYDADTGAEVATKELAPFGTVINDVAITRDAVYFTDFTNPYLYRVSLSRNGKLSAGEGVLPISLVGDDPNDELADPATANGIVAKPNGDTLIIGDSTTAQIYRVDPMDGHSVRIIVDPPLEGFIDGIVLHRDQLYILTPGTPDTPDRVQVVALDREWLTGTRLDDITDPDNLDGVASGAMLGSALYVNNARYSQADPETGPKPDTEYWVTRLKINKAKSE